MIKIITLMDNTPGPAGTSAEHGLSFLVEREGRKLIFDTGKTGAFLENARVLGAGWMGAEALVISHGHYDHGGGVRTLYGTGVFIAPLWTGPDFFDKKWSHEKPEPRYLGVDFDDEYLALMGVEHKVVRGTQGQPVSREILPGIHAVNGFPRIHPEEKPNSRFVVDREGNRVQDDFRDEICLALDLPDGIAVVLGCAHPGILNMLDAVRGAFNKPLLAVFGGSHLVDADAHRLAVTVDYLKASGCGTAALGHCTGKEGAAAMAGELACYKPLSVGASWELI